MSVNISNLQLRGLPTIKATNSAMKCEICMARIAYWVQFSVTVLNVLKQNTQKKGQKRLSGMKIRDRWPDTTTARYTNIQTDGQIKKN